VNGGLARSEGRRVKPSAGASSEGYRRESASPLRRERTGARPRVARDRHSAVATSPKAVQRSRDRGRNGHRILRRVPADGRHLGSSRGVLVHAKRSRWSWQFPHPPTRTNRPKEGRTARLQLPRRWERRGDEPQEIATEMSEARSRQRRGKKTPTLMTLQCRKAIEHGFSVARRSAEAVLRTS